MFSKMKKELGHKQFLIDDGVKEAVSAFFFENKAKALFYEVINKYIFRLACEYIKQET